MCVCVCVRARARAEYVDVISALISLVCIYLLNCLFANSCVILRSWGWNHFHFVYCTYVCTLLVSFCAGHCAEDLARDHAPMKSLLFYYYLLLLLLLLMLLLLLLLLLWLFSPILGALRPVSGVYHCVR